MPRMSRLIAAPVLLAMALACCANAEGPGATQPPPASQGTLSGGQCLTRGTRCVANRDCCTEWCANGACAMQSP